MSFREDTKIKIKKLDQLNIPAYESHYDITHSIEEIIHLSENTFIKTAGRIVFFRDLGGIAFIKISNIKGTIQLFLNKKINKFLINPISEESIFKYINMGDIIGVEGKIIFTQTGEKSIDAQKICILSKCLEQISDKWHGITDIEAKLRRRHLDLISNQETRNIFNMRYQLIRNIRDYLHSKSFLEVETPILQNIPSGASAYPFKTYYEALNEDFYLRIAPELFLKRLIISGYDKIFEIAKCFRNEGIDRSHLQEFTMLEFYITYISYEALQEFCIHFIQQIIFNTLGTLKTSYIDFSQVERITYDDLFLKYGNINIKNKTYEDLQIIAQENDINYHLYNNIDALTDIIYKKICLSKIINPVLIYDYPATPLSYPHKEKKGYNYQFQIIIGKFEIIRACIELTDPEIQNNNFDKQMELNLQKGEKDIVRKDEDFIKTLKSGMPPTGGVGLGIDRLMMLLNNLGIRDIILFPATKIKK
jgi:lysyl-tRNA synthetase, class II